MAKKKLSKDTKITSTSDFTIGDIIDAVADSIADGGTVRESVRSVVCKTVRPCAIGGVATVVAGADGKPTVINASPNSPGFCGDGGNDPGVYHKGTTAEPLGTGGSAGGRKGRIAPARLEVPADEERPCPAITGRMVDRSDLLSRETGATGDIAGNSMWRDIVLQNGEVWTPYTNRRFLPAQYLWLMESFSGNIDAAIACRYNLRDCFRLLDDEIEKLIFMAKHWRVAYAERQRFLPIETVRSIFLQYLAALEKNINDRDKCEFKPRSGEYRRRIQGEGVVVLWTKKTRHTEGDDGAESDVTTIEPSEWLVRLNDRIRTATRMANRLTDYEKALELLRDYLPHVSMGVFRDSAGRYRNWLPKAWKDAFKKEGAYYTLKSLVVNCHVRYTTEDIVRGRVMTDISDSARDGLNKLRLLLDGSVPAYVVHAILKKSIGTSGLDVGKLLKSWRRR